MAGPAMPALLRCGDDAEGFRMLDPFSVAASITLGVVGNRADAGISSTIKKIRRNWSAPVVHNSDLELALRDAMRASLDALALWPDWGDEGKQLLNVLRSELDVWFPATYSHKQSAVLNSLMSESESLGPRLWELVGPRCAHSSPDLLEELRHRLPGSVSRSFFQALRSDEHRRAFIAFVTDMLMDNRASQLEGVKGQEAIESKLDALLASKDHIRQLASATLDVILAQSDQLTMAEQHISDASLNLGQLVAGLERIRNLADGAFVRSDGEPLLVPRHGIDQLILDDLNKTAFAARPGGMAFLDQVAESGGYHLLVAPSGAGKSKLLAHWLAHHRTGADVCFHFFSTAGWRNSSVFGGMACLAEQLLERHGIRGDVQESEPERLRQIVHTALSLPHASGLTVIVEGIDEAQHASFRDEFPIRLGWFPAKLPDGVSVIFTVRPHHGGNTAWFLERQLGIKGFTQCADLDNLDAEAVADLIGQCASGPLRQMADEEQFCADLVARTGGLAIYLDHLIQELDQLATPNEWRDRLASIPERFAAFVQQAIADAISEDGWVNALRFLAIAREPLMTQELIHLAERSGKPLVREQLEIDRLNWRIRRWLKHEGTREDDLWAFQHPSIADAMIDRESEEGRRYLLALIDYCSSTTAARSNYTLLYLPELLSDVALMSPPLVPVARLFALATDIAYLNAQARYDKADRGRPLQTIRLALSHATLETEADPVRVETLTALLIEHAKRAQELSVVRHPVDSLRTLPTKRIHELLNIHEPEDQLLWAALLLWQFGDDPDAAVRAEVIPMLQSGSLPRLTSWRRIVAAFLLPQLAGADIELLATVARQSLGSDGLLDACQYARTSEQARTIYRLCDRLATHLGPETFRQAMRMLTERFLALGDIDFATRACEGAELEDSGGLMVRYRAERIRVSLATRVVPDLVLAVKEHEYFPAADSALQVRVLAWLARSFERERNTATAEQLIDAALETALHQTDHEAVLRCAIEVLKIQLSMGSGQTDESIQRIIASARHADASVGPDSFLEKVARLLVDAGQIDQALRVAKEIESLIPRVKSARRIASALAARGQDNEATKAIKSLHLPELHEADLLVAVAEICGDQAKPLSVRRLVDLARPLIPASDPGLGADATRLRNDTLAQLIGLHVRLGEPEIARQMIDAEQDQAARDAAFRHIALAYCRDGDLDNAQKATEQIRFGSALLAETWVLTAKWLAEDGKLELAREVVNNIRDRVKRSEALKYVAIAELEAGLPAEARSTAIAMDDAQRRDDCLVELVERQIGFSESDEAIKTAMGIGNVEKRAKSVIRIAESVLAPGSKQAIDLIWRLLQQEEEEAGDIQEQALTMVIEGLVRGGRPVDAWIVTEELSKTYQREVVKMRAALALAASGELADAEDIARSISAALPQASALASLAVGYAEAGNASKAERIVGAIDVADLRWDTAMEIGRRKEIWDEAEPFLKIAHEARTTAFGKKDDVWALRETSFVLRAFRQEEGAAALLKEAAFVALSIESAFDRFDSLLYVADAYSYLDVREEATSLFAAARAAAKLCPERFGVKSPSSTLTRLAASLARLRQADAAIDICMDIAGAGDNRSRALLEVTRVLLRNGGAASTQQVIDKMSRAECKRLAKLAVLSCSEQDQCPALYRILEWLAGASEMKAKVRGELLTEIVHHFAALEHFAGIRDTIADARNPYWRTMIRISAAVRLLERAQAAALAGDQERSACLIKESFGLLGEVEEWQVLTNRFPEVLAAFDTLVSDNDEIGSLLSRMPFAERENMLPCVIQHEIATGKLGGAVRLIELMTVDRPLRLPAIVSALALRGPCTRGVIQALAPECANRVRTLPALCGCVASLYPDCGSSITKAVREHAPRDATAN